MVQTVWRHDFVAPVSYPRKIYDSLKSGMRTHSKITTVYHTHITNSVFKLVVSL